MNVKIYLILLFLFPFFLYAQEEKESRKVELEDGSFVVPDKYPEVIKDAKPKFPKQAILQDIQGKVYVKVTIDVNGKVADFKIIKGSNKTLNIAAIDAAKQMQFSPAIIKGKAVKSSIAVPISFIIDPEQLGPKLESGKKSNAIVPDKKGSQSKTRQRNKNVEEKEKNDEPDPSAFTQVKKEPTPISQVKPIYPESAAKKGITGLVVLRVLISKEGKPVRSIVFRADNEIFIEPAKKAVMQTIFSPAIQDGKPIACWLNMPFKFTLGEGPKKK